MLLVFIAHLGKDRTSNQKLLGSNPDRGNFFNLIQSCCNLDYNYHNCNSFGHGIQKYEKSYHDSIFREYKELLLSISTKLLNFIICVYNGNTCNITLRLNYAHIFLNLMK